MTVAEFRGWLRDHLPEDWRTPEFPRMLPPGDADTRGMAISRAWQERLYSGGWAAPGWPVAHGGRGCRLDEQLAITTELALARAPVPIGYQAVELIGPTMIRYGAPSLNERLLPGMLSGTDVWCQGYSEPDAGSDLGSMRTVARREGDRYVVSGQKVWTSAGRRADWCLLLARTGPAESGHAGISCFAVAMSTPGLEWRPTRDLTGIEEFGELFLDHVEVPAEQRIGAENDGWRVAMASLGHERLLASSAAYVRARFVAATRLPGGPRLARARRDRLARLAARVTALEGLEARALALGMDDDPRFPVWASMVKLAGTELRQDIASFAVEALGADGLTWSPASSGAEARAAAWRDELLESRACTIYGGSSEIQRNIVAERGLGLPREQR